MGYGMPLILSCVPYDLDWNLGRAYNRVMENLPDDGWACLLDHDAMFTTGVWYRQLVDAIEREPRGTFTCVTNRIGDPNDSRQHWQRAEHAEAKSNDVAAHRQYGQSRVEIPNLRDVTKKFFLMGGVLILISKEAWRDMGGFKDGLRGVDYAAHIALRKAGRRIFCIEGLYLYHWKRADGSKFPKGTPICDWRGELESHDVRRQLVTTDA